MYFFGQILTKGSALEMDATRMLMNAGAETVDQVNAERGNTVFVRREMDEMQAK